MRPPQYYVHVSSDPLMVLLLYAKHIIFHNTSVTTRPWQESWVCLFNQYRLSRDATARQCPPFITSWIITTYNFTSSCLTEIELTCITHTHIYINTLECYIWACQCLFGHDMSYNKGNPKWAELTNESSLHQWTELKKH